MVGPSLFFLLVLAAFSCAQTDSSTAPANHLVIGTEQGYPPYSFTDRKTGQPTGFNIELSRAVAHAAGFTVDIVYKPWADILDDFCKGRIDCIAGMYASPQRDTFADFTTPFARVHHTAFAHTHSPAVKKVADLQNRKIIVMYNDIMHDFIRTHHLTDQVTVVKTQEEAIRMLSRESHDFALLAKLPGLFWVKELNADNVRPVGPVLQPTAYCFAAAEGNTELVSHLNEGIAIVRESGIYENLSRTWFGTLTQIGRAHV
jgi:polar amino acid transport system substrate-binding protein